MTHKPAAQKACQRTVYGEQGSIAVVAAFAMTALLCFTAAGVDLGVAFHNASTLQTALDAGALAGAAALPDQSQARLTALTYVEANGLEPDQVDIEFSADSREITLSSTKTAETAFLPVIGVDELTVSRTATARRTQRREGIFDYRIFSGSETHTFYMGGTFDIDGDIHANGSVSVSPSRGVIRGGVEAARNVYVNPYTTQVEWELEGVEVLEMPEFDAVIAGVMPAYYDSYETNAAYNSEWRPQVWEGNKYISGNVSVSNGVTIHGQTYIDGNLTINGSGAAIYGDLFVDGDINFNNSISVYGCIFATGDINCRGGGMLVNPSSPVCVYSETGDINMSMAGSTTVGLVYAPEGAVNIAGNNITFYGSIIAHIVSGIPANLTMEEPPEDLPFLPTRPVITLIN